ncbi:MAG: decarboxylating 6-phosphogluconate dehydrogenase [Chloroflexi bacterium]|nr:decarboxylating 6-phosphogluconate dehydrogenase [Chloroflexota bacterium]
MELGMVGLGRMGGNMAERLHKAGHRVVAYDRSAEARQAAEGRGLESAASLEEVVQALNAPRAVWVMVPSGKPTEDTLTNLAGLLSPGDTIIEGGNSNYKETIRRGEDLAKHGVTMVDAGTSGGIWGLTEGYSLMVGGERDVVQRLEPLFHALEPAPDKGYGHVGPLGSGHFTKMVHNGIEYGLMQAYAEGFELMQAKSEFKLDLHQIAELWRHGSVVRSWLLDLTAAALAEEPGLESLEAYVDDSGEGRWTVDEAVALAVPLPVITAALQVRFRSRQEQPYSAKILAAMRNQFGGHAVRKSE